MSGDRSCGVERHADTYVDSVLLLAATRAMQDTEGITWATALMATPANLEVLVEEGMPGAGAGRRLGQRPAAGGAGPDDGAIERALARRRRRAVRRAGADGLGPGRGHRRSRPDHSRPRAAGRQRRHRLRARAVRRARGAQGPPAGLDVLLFSDNVLPGRRDRAQGARGEVGHLVMGPGAGTAVLGGCGLGLRQRRAPGRVGVVAAAGTGAQEVMSLLDRWGEGVTQVIGVGGRDLSADVGGRMAALAVRALDADPATEIILLVSKPPSPEVARAVVAAAGATPIVVAASSASGHRQVVAGRPPSAPTLEGGVCATLEPLGSRPAPTWATGAPPRRRPGAGRAGPRAHAGPRALLRGHPLLRGAHRARALAGAGLVQHPARQAPSRAGAGRQPHLPGPG